MLGKCPASELSVTVISFCPLIVSHFIQHVWVILIFLFSFSQKIPSFTTHLIFVPPQPLFQDQFVLPKYSWMCVLPLECGLVTGGYTLRDHCLSFSRQLLTPWLAWDCVLSSFFMLAGIGLGCVCTGFVHAAAITVCSYMQPPCCVQRRFPPNHQLSLALIFFLLTHM